MNNRAGSIQLSPFPCLWCSGYNLKGKLGSDIMLKMSPQSSRSQWNPWRSQWSELVSRSHCPPSSGSNDWFLKSPRTGLWKNRCCGIQWLVFFGLKPSRPLKWTLRKTLLMDNDRLLRTTFPAAKTWKLARLTHGQCIASFLYQMSIFVTNPRLVPTIHLWMVLYMYIYIHIQYTHTYIYIHTITIDSYIYSSTINLLLYHYI